MRWTRRTRRTNVADADGEVAWVLPPDAEAKFAMMFTSPATGARKARSPGEREL